MSHYIRVLLNGGSVKPATLEEFLQAESAHNKNPHNEAFLAFGDETHITVRKDRTTNELILLVSAEASSPEEGSAK